MAFNIPTLPALGAIGSIVSLLPVSDQVCVLNNSFTQLFPNARPVDVSIKEDAKTMEHPLEDGYTITDHRIINPIEIQINFLIKSEFFKDTYQQIKQQYLKGDLLVVQTKTGRYKNMLLGAIPHVENTETLDTIPINLSFKEALIVEAQYGTLPPSKVASEKDSSTVDRGEQQGTEASSEKKGSVLFSLKQKLTK